MKEGPWYVPNKWFVSPYNFVEEVRKGYDFPERVFVRDVTLHEGQHQPGVIYTLEGMLKIARALYEAGIPEIKQGADDFQVLEFIRAIKREIPELKITCIIKTGLFRKFRESPSEGKKIIDTYIDARSDEINFPTFTSWQRDKEEEWTKQEMISTFVEMIEYVRSRGVGAELGPYDTARQYLDDLKEIFGAGLKAGMTRIGVYDSYNSSTFDGMKYLISEIKKIAKGVPILVHSHNDFGMTVATTIGGIAGGATYCDLSVNGLGDRAGNCPLEPTVLALEALYGVRTGVNLENLVKLSRLVEEVTGWRCHDYMPIGGRNVFTHESEAHARKILDYGVEARFVPSAEGYSPEVVGGKRVVKFGGISLVGEMIEIRLNSLGLTYNEKCIEEIRRRIQDIFMKQKRDITLEEFDAIAREICTER